MSYSSWFWSLFKPSHTKPIAPIPTPKPTIEPVHIRPTPILINPTAGDELAAVILGALTTPVLTINSALGSAPVVFGITMGADIFEGFYLRLQVDNELTFSTPLAQDITHILTANEHQSGVFDLTGELADPSGRYYAQCWWERDDGAISAKSNIVTDVITVSVNKFATVNGTDKSQYVDTQANFHSLIVNNDVNSTLLVRATTQAPAKGHFEVIIDGFHTSANLGGSGIQTGICDSGAVTGFATFGAQPGAASTAGCAAILKKGDTNLGVYENGNFTNYALGVTIAVGDGIIMELDKAANQVQIWFYRGATTISTLIRTLTLTGAYIPVVYFAYAGGYRGTAGSPTIANSDSCTGNFGNAAWVKAPTAGFAGW